MKGFRKVLGLPADSSNRRQPDIG